MPPFHIRVWWTIRFWRLHPKKPDLNPLSSEQLPSDFSKRLQAWAEKVNEIMLINHFFVAKRSRKMVCLIRTIEQEVENGGKEKIFHYFRVPFGLSPISCFCGGVEQEL